MADHNGEVSDGVASSGLAHGSDEDGSLSSQAPSTLCSVAPQSNPLSSSGYIAFILSI